MRLMPGQRRPGALVATVTAALLLTAPGLAAAPASASAVGSPAASGSAPGGPGAQSYLDLARKDCFGTARDTTSKVWFTVADGVLSDVYNPSIENSNVKTLQYIVTDGKTFTDMQQRDMTYTVSSPDRSGLVCQVTSRDAKARLPLVTDYLTDPARDSVVMRTTLEPLPGGRAALRHLKVYVRYDAQIDNTGGGGNANGRQQRPVDPATTLWSPPTPTRLPALGRRGHVTGRSPTGRSAASGGFVGTPSDGLTQLDADTGWRMCTTRRRWECRADSTVNSVPRGRSRSRSGWRRRAAAIVAGGAAPPSTRPRWRYVAGWHAYDETLRRPPPR